MAAAAAAWCGDWCTQFSGNWSGVAQGLATVLPIWALGALFGFLIPRPKTWSGATTSSILSSLALPGPRWLAAWHGAVILREVWYHWTAPGTFRRFAKAVLGLFLGRKWSFDFPERPTGLEALGTPCATGPATAMENESAAWYVTEKDLGFFQYHAEEGSPAPGASAWELMMDREIPNVVKYTAWRRTLANGKTEYKSLTISPDATAEEFMDMYLDDDNRPSWDTMIVEHQVLEQGDFAQRQQVVRWLRRFPFSFITDREYILAKRLFRMGPCLYGITKAVDHPNAPPPSNVVRMDVFYSMWRSRTVDCPWASGSPACETLLLHHEQFKIPENLGRFAVSRGMWGFVRKLSSETPKFVEARRKRCDPNQPDPQAYGYNIPQVTSTNGPFAAAASTKGLRGVMPSVSNGALGASTPSPGKPGMRRVTTSTSALSMLSSTSSAELPGGQDNNSYGDLLYRGSTGGLNGTLTAMVQHHHGHAAHHASLYGMNAQQAGSAFASAAGQAPHMRGRTGSSNKLKGLAAFAIASGLALLMQRSSSNTDPIARALSIGDVSSGTRRGIARSGSMRRGRSRIFSENGSSHSLSEVAEVKGH